MRDEQRDAGGADAQFSDGVKRVIVALDLKDGRVVKGVQFEGFKDAGDPAELAAHYDRDGADEIYLLDITATIQGRSATEEAVARTSQSISVPLVVGGGISSVGVMQRLMDAGASKMCLNSAAVADPDLIKQGADAFGREAMVLSIDCARRVHADGSVWWEVVTGGGRRATGLDAVKWAEQAESLGIGEIILNSIETDGVKGGYDNELNRAVSSAVDVPIIASGGAGNLQHLVDGIIVGGADGVLAASIFHFGDYTMSEAKAYLAQHGIQVRRG